MRSIVFALPLALCLSLASFAQTPKLEPGAPVPVIPTVTFTFDWSPAHPPYYSIAVDSAGRAAYTAVDDKKDTGEPYMLKFTVSRESRERIFAAAHVLNYFQGKFDFTRHKVAFTGSKTLAYADPTHHSQATYNWSENNELMSLTQLFVGIANTVNGGRKLERLHRFDRLGLNDELKELELEARDHYLAEVQVIEPVLRQIADDPNVLDLARQRARRLLALAAAKESAASGSR